MSDRHDKRRRTDLELFVLALIDGGIATPYELQRSAGLSPGATIPALQRLVIAGYAISGKPGSRGRVEYRVTRSGAKLLTNSWRLLIDTGPSGDRDADLRVALLALWVGGDRRSAVDFLRLSAGKKLESIDAAKAEPSVSQPSSLGNWYRELRSLSAIALVNGEVEAIRSMAEALPKPPAAKRTNKP
jgi:DNA-binding PadR family transcriptional regulator